MYLYFLLNILNAYGTVVSNINTVSNFGFRGDNIQLIRLATFINEEVGQRQLPKNIDEKTLGKPSVVMKLDIEGSEVEVIEDLIMQGIY